MLRGGHAVDYAEAITLGNAMLDAGIFHHVQWEHRFKDKGLFFRWVLCMCERYGPHGRIACIKSSLSDGIVTTCNGDGHIFCACDVLFCVHLQTYLTVTARQQMTGLKVQASIAARSGLPQMLRTCALLGMRIDSGADTQDVDSLQLGVPKVVPTPLQQLPSIHSH